MSVQRLIVSEDDCKNLSCALLEFGQFQLPIHIVDFLLFIFKHEFIAKREH